MAYNTSVYALQNSVNRFASAAKFATIAADGVWGPQTQTALDITLAWMMKMPCTSTNHCIAYSDAQTASTLLSSMSGAADAATSATFLQVAADELGLAVVKPPVTQVLTNAGNAAIQQIFPATPGSWSASALTTWQGLATWQKLGLGVVAGFGTMWAVKRVKQLHGGKGAKGASR